MQISLHRSSLLANPTNPAHRTHKGLYNADITVLHLSSLLVNPTNTTHRIHTGLNNADITVLHQFSLLVNPLTLYIEYTQCSELLAVRRSNANITLTDSSTQSGHWGRCVSDDSSVTVTVYLWSTMECRQLVNMSVMTAVSQ